MLRKIETIHLRTGMYVDRLVGSWLDHPFWKKSFVVDDRHLSQLRGSAVREVWIDTRRGVDLDELADRSVIDDDSLATLIMAAPPDDEYRGATSLADELGRAGAILGSARSATRALFDDARLGLALDAEHCLPLVDEIARSLERNSVAIVSLARLKTSDDYTYMHSVAVCVLMVALARQLGLSDDLAREAGLAGLLHDIGKVMMPPAILDKPGALTDAEFAVMKGHPLAGHALLRDATGVPDSAMEVCLHHHERMDGHGYPDRLDGSQLSLLVRMGAICDVYDAITSNRAYKPGWDPAISVQKMAQWSRDGHFDDRVLQAFVKSIGIYPLGSLVRLSSGRIAVVVDHVPGRLLTPIVTAILDATTREPCAPERIDLGATNGDRIASREIAASWNVTAIDDFWRRPS